MTVVYIAGMHRSGTSMVARLLNLCGVYLGEESQLTPPADDNPEGFWEHVEFRSINEAILASFGGDWDLPPTFKAEWEKSETMNVLRPQVNDLINRFSKESHWGWKDPRNSLTLPFWKSFLPGLKIVVCLRNPYDVYRSLARRGYSSSAFSYQLWLSYYQQLLKVLESNSYMITHFDSYFHDPQSELRRVLNFLGMQATGKTLEEACQTISPNLRHNHGSTSDIVTTQAPVELLKIYRELCHMAGSVYDLSITDAERMALENLGLAKETSIDDYQSTIALLKRELRLKDGELRSKEEKLVLQESQFQKLTEISDLSNKETKNEIERLKAELSNIYKSRRWRYFNMLQSFWKFILRQNP